MQLPWKQLGALLLILTIGAASTGPPPSHAGQARRARDESWLAHQPTVRKTVPEAELRNVRFSASAAKRIAAVSHTTALLTLCCVNFAGRLGPAAAHVGLRIASTHAAEVGGWTSGLGADVWQAALWQSPRRPLGLTNFSPPNIIGSSAALRLATRLLTHSYLRPVTSVVRLTTTVCGLF